MNGMESVRDLLDGAEHDHRMTPRTKPMRWQPPPTEPPADHEEPST